MEATSTGPTRGTCAFCGLTFGPRDSPRERTGEHVLAKWLLDVMPGQGPVTHHRQSTPRGPVDQVWTAGQLDIVAKRVCKECNGGWMNDLEGQARRYLTAMIQGRGIDLHREGQTATAAWAAKTALAANLTTDAKPAPPEHYREIANTHLPPAQTYVWLAAFDGSVAAHHHTSHLALDSASYHADGYCTTLAIGHLVVQVLGYTGIEDQMTFQRGAWLPATEAIWPIKGEPRRWPPRRILDRSGLAALASMFEKGD